MSERTVTFESDALASGADDIMNEAAGEKRKLQGRKPKGKPRPLPGRPKGWSTMSALERFVFSRNTKKGK